MRNHENISDGSVLGPVLKDRPDRPIFARTGPPEDRSKKTERPRSFFGLFFEEKSLLFGNIGAKNCRFFSPQQVQFVSTVLTFIMLSVNMMLTLLTFNMLNVNTVNIHHVKC